MGRGDGVVLKSTYPFKRVEDVNGILLTHIGNDGGPIVCQPLAQGLSVYYITAHKEFGMLEH